MEEVEETSGEISHPGTRCAGGDVDGLIVAMRLLHCNNGLEFMALRHPPT
jgi:hypothetical protein